MKKQWLTITCFLLVFLLSLSLFGVSASALEVGSSGIIPPGRVVATPPSTGWYHDSSGSVIPTYDQFLYNANANTVGSPYVVASANVESCAYWNKFYTSYTKMPGVACTGFEIMIGANQPFKYIGNQVFIPSNATEFYFYIFTNNLYDQNAWINQKPGIMQIPSRSEFNPVTVYSNSFVGYKTINPQIATMSNLYSWCAYFNVNQVEPNMPGNFFPKGVNEVLSPLWYTRVRGTDLKFYNTLDDSKPVAEIPTIKWNQNFSGVVEFRDSNGNVMYSSESGGYKYTDPNGVADDTSLFQFGMFDAVLEEMGDCLTTPAAEAQPITITAFGRVYTLLSPTIRNISVWQYVVLICQISVLIGCLYWLFKCIQFGIGGFGFE